MGLIGWLAAFIVFIGIEIPTMALTTIWFAGGALVGLLLYLLGASLEVQLVAFVIVSFALLALTRPMALRYINQKTKKTNVEGLVGKQARVTENVDNAAGTGAAVLEGQEWTARAFKDGLIIPPGTMVRVEEIRGVKLMVMPEQEDLVC
ncbi:MAG: NfeD family protein [Lachnospiraceae bacterium]|nr:NfeD family protein [Lachnospiraceae bacterium]